MMDRDRDEYLDRVDEAWLDHERPAERAAEELICESCGEPAAERFRCTWDERLMVGACCQADADDVADRRREIEWDSERPEDRCPPRE